MLCWNPSGVLRVFEHKPPILLVWLCNKPFCASGSVTKLRKCWLLLFHFPLWRHQWRGQVAQHRCGVISLLRRRGRGARRKYEGCKSPEHWVRVGKSVLRFPLLLCKEAWVEEPEEDLAQGLRSRDLGMKSLDEECECVKERDWPGAGVLDWNSP